MMQLPSVDQTEESRPLRVNPTTSAAGSPDPPGSSIDLSPVQTTGLSSNWFVGFYVDGNLFAKDQVRRQTEKGPRGFHIQSSKKSL